MKITFLNLRTKLKKQVINGRHLCHLSIDLNKMNHELQIVMKDEINHHNRVSYTFSITHYRVIECCRTTINYIQLKMILFLNNIL